MNKKRTFGEFYPRPPRFNRGPRRVSGKPQGKTIPFLFPFPFRDLKGVLANLGSRCFAFGSGTNIAENATNPISFGPSPVNFFWGLLGHFCNPPDELNNRNLWAFGSMRSFASCPCPTIFFPNQILPCSSRETPRPFIFFFLPAPFLGHLPENPDLIHEPGVGAPRAATDPGFYDAQI